MQQQHYEDFDQPKPTEQEDSKPKNMKNIYIQKLSKYFNLSRENLADVQQDDHDLQTPHAIKRQVRSSININSIEGRDLNDKLEKNRESARKARKRKKLYVKLLEKQVEKYKDIAAQGKELQKDVQKFMTQLRTHVSKKKDHASLKPVVMNNIMNAVSFSNQFGQNDISALITKYQNKFGPSSTQRFENIDTSLKQIKQIFLPGHITSILNSDSQKLIKQMQKNNNGQRFDSNEISQIKELIDKQCQKLHHSLNVLKQTIDMTKQQLRQINQTIDQMKQQHGGTQTCRFLMMIQEQSSKPANVKQFKQFLDQLNFDSVKQNNEERYQAIFKDDYKKNVVIKGKVSEDLIRRIHIYLDREII